MKIIKIKSCKDCPYLGSTGDHCNQSLSRRILSTELPIPGWCPLEEVWVNIKYQLPPQGERVLVWLWEKGENDIDILRKEGKSDGGGFQFIKNYQHNITFWGPLPAPP